MTEHPDHWRKERLAEARDATVEGRYAEAAVHWLLEAEFTLDILERQNGLRKALVCSQLALRDSVEELKATYKETTTTAIEKNAELSATMKKAANVIYTEVRRATVKPAPQAESKSGAA